uniref:Uncharacterized protein n=1 Tax=Arundo donax TaxID=35708 RepID=A0A0A9B0C7_ARUDO
MAHNLRNTLCGIDSFTLVPISELHEGEKSESVKISSATSRENLCTKGGCGLSQAVLHLCTALLVCDPHHQVFGVASSWNSL